MTGVEAVSNGVKAFREPTVPNAQRTLTVIIGLLAVLLAGIAYLVRAYGILATDPGQPGYQSVISMLVAAVVGRGWFYYFTIGSVLIILSLSANTAFADFPRLCKAVAQDGFLPHSFGYRGRRLVYSQGIYVLAVLTANPADPLRRRHRPADPALRHRRVSGVHAVAGRDGRALAASDGARLACTACSSTGWARSPRAMTLVVVLVAKFTSGAWVSVLLIAGMMTVDAAGCDGTTMRSPRKFAMSEPAANRAARARPSSSCRFRPGRRFRSARMEFALTLSPEVHAVHVGTEEENSNLQRELEAPGRADPVARAGGTPPNLVMLPSPYRLIIKPILDFVLEWKRRTRAGKSR